MAAHEIEAWMDDDDNVVKWRNLGDNGQPWYAALHMHAYADCPDGCVVLSFDDSEIVVHIQRDMIDSGLEELTWRR
jgi:hypothetical protein